MYACEAPYPVVRSIFDGGLDTMLILDCNRIFDTLHLIGVSSTLYYYLISNYAYPSAIFTQNLWYVGTIKLRTKTFTLYLGRWRYQGDYGKQTHLLECIERCINTYF